MRIRGSIRWGVAAWGLVLGLAAGAWAQDGGKAAEPPKALPADRLRAELTAAVDAPTPAARAKAAQALAARDDVQLEALLVAMGAFGEFARQTPGPSQHKVPLQVEGRVLETEIDVYVPESYDPKRPAPLLMAFHGAGGDGRRLYYDWEAVAEQLGMLVVAPTEPGEPGGYRFTRDERHVSLEALRWARRRFNVDENRIFLTGISRGGHLTWDIALRFPDRWAGIAPMIGGPRWNVTGGQNNLRYMENVAWMPIRDLQGWQDDPRMLFNLELAFEKLETFKAPDALLHRFPELGHSFQLDVVDWKAFFGEKRRPAIPERVVRTAARPDEARSFWLEITQFDGKVKEVFPLKMDARKLASMSEDAKRRWAALAADPLTARLAGRMPEPGVFHLEERQVKKARLLLSEGMFLPGQPIEVFWNGKPRKKTVKTDKGVLLADFVERFDRTFLPVAEVAVP